MSVVVVNHLSLDGVLQGPGRPDEDRRDGFAYGGWARSSDDPLVAEALGKVMGQGFSWLFGRFSYEDMLGYWNEAGGPFRDGLNNTTKYVASSDEDYRPPWPNTQLVTGDVPARVAELRATTEGNLVVMGSGQLIRSLLPGGLIDRLLLLIHPVVLGSGRRLFGPADVPVPLQLVDSEATSDGLLVATYEPVG
ncbi:dihydrofolate reductase [Branchiibius hedensis]|uniref:Dihydrofolate reductase n=1 Tax=Branchiibius hedensis TaxID=672460 RepID=A0A2Y8ZLH4_9MICO|nr:dihydrofolate reductase family protein [Branchiibius hedensis]PWJ24373.1 dihydrofolate reductase [Branchiibius hedensis]SSA33190.1 Dihydrofolate reductase [Branchiibius hedensis]